MLIRGNPDGNKWSEMKKKIIYLIKGSLYIDKNIPLCLLYIL